MRSISAGITFLLIAGVALAGACLSTASASQTQSLKWYSGAAPFGLTVSLGTPARLSWSQFRHYAFPVVVKNQTKNSLSFLNNGGVGLAIHMYDHKGKEVTDQRPSASLKLAGLSAGMVITIPAGRTTTVTEDVGSTFARPLPPGQYRLSVVLTGSPAAQWPPQAAGIALGRHSHIWPGQEVMSPAAPIAITR